MPTTPNDVTNAHRAHLVAARDMIGDAVANPDTDLAPASAILSTVATMSNHIRAYFLSGIYDARRLITAADRTPDTLRHAIQEIDLILDETCPHAPELWRVIDGGEDRFWVTCPGCQVSWMSDGAGVPEHV